MRKEGEVYKYQTYYYDGKSPTKVPMTVDRSKDLNGLIGSKVVDAFNCRLEDDYYATFLLLEDERELEIVPDGEYGTCSLRIDGDEIQ